MAKENKLQTVIAVRVDDDLKNRIVREQESENRRVISEMARILLIEALNVRAAKAKRKK